MDATMVAHRVDQSGRTRLVPGGTRLLATHALGIAAGDALVAGLVVQRALVLWLETAPTTAAPITPALPARPAAAIIATLAAITAGGTAAGADASLAGLPSGTGVPTRPTVGGISGQVDAALLLPHLAAGQPRRTALPAFGHPHATRQGREHPEQRTAAGAGCTGRAPHQLVKPSVIHCAHVPSRGPSDGVSLDSDAHHKVSTSETPPTNLSKLNDRHCRISKTEVYGQNLRALKFPRVAQVIVFHNPPRNQRLETCDVRSF